MLPSLAQDYYSVPLCDRRPQRQVTDADTGTEHIMRMWKTEATAQIFGPQTPTGVPRESWERVSYFSISVRLAEMTHLAAIKPHRLLTETSFLRFWLELHQPSVIKPLISC